GEFFFHDGTRPGEVHLAGMALFEFAHYTAHILDAGSPRLRDHGLHGSRRFLGRELLWHEALDDRDFLIFLLGKLGAARLFVNARGFAALLHHARQDFKDFSVTHTCIPPVCASSNIAILHGSLNETQRTD